MNLTQARKFLWLLQETQPPARPHHVRDGEPLETIVERVENHSTPDGIHYIYVKLACYDSTLIVFPQEDLLIRKDGVLCLYDKDMDRVRPCTLSWRRGTGGGARNGFYYTYLDATVKTQDD